MEGASTQPDADHVTFQHHLRLVALEASLGEYLASRESELTVAEHIHHLGAALDSALKYTIGLERRFFEFRDEVRAGGTSSGLPEA